MPAPDSQYADVLSTRKSTNAPCAYKCSTPTVNRLSVMTIEEQASESCVIESDGFFIFVSAELLYNGYIYRRKIRVVTSTD